MVGQFEQAMRLMRKHDPQVREDGFAMLSATVASHLPSLIDAFGAEVDPGMRRWLFELIVSAADPRALPILVASLSDPDESVRDRAVDGLEHLDTRDSRIALRRFRGEPIY